MNLINNLDLDGIALLEEILDPMLFIKRRDIYFLIIRNYLFYFGRLEKKKNKRK